MGERRGEVKVKTGDGQIFFVSKDITKLSSVLTNMLKFKERNSDQIHLKMIKGRIFQKVVDWCEQHKDDPKPLIEKPKEMRLRGGVKEDLCPWDSNFLGELDQNTLFHIVQASTKLKIKGLSDLTCRRVAAMISSCENAQEVREKFNIRNDFTPDQEERILIKQITTGYIFDHLQRIEDWIEERKPQLPSTSGL